MDGEKAWHLFSSEDMIKGYDRTKTRTKRRNGFAKENKENEYTSNLDTTIVGRSSSSSSVNLQNRKLSKFI